MFSQIKVLHRDYSSWKINHNKLAAEEDFSLILTTIASISTSKRHKGFLQLSLDASRRLSAFLSITLKVAVEGERDGEFANVSNRICGGQYHLSNWHHYKDEKSHTFKISRQTDGQKVGKMNWCRDECVCVGLCCFSIVFSVRLFPAPLSGESYNDVHEYIKD